MVEEEGSARTQMGWYQDPLVAEVGVGENHLSVIASGRVRSSLQKETSEQTENSSLSSGLLVRVILGFWSNHWSKLLGWLLC